MSNPQDPASCADWYFRGWAGVFKLIKGECLIHDRISVERLELELDYMEREIGKCRAGIKKKRLKAQHVPPPPPPSH